MALNVERLVEELRFVTMNPEKHDQGLWARVETEAEIPAGIEIFEVADVEVPRPSACGSFGCLAGNTAIHEPGVELDWYQNEYRRENGKKVQVWQADDILNEYVTRGDEDDTWTDQKPISVKAAEILDLTPWQAERLFDGDNTLDRLWELADEFTGGEISSNQHNDMYNEWSYGRALHDRDQKIAEDAIRAAAEKRANPIED